MKESDTTQSGRYEPVTMLGEGGMARAYLAVSRGPLGLDKLVVVKQVRPELAWDRDFLKMFFDEARIAARLNHPNVVQTYEVVEDAGQYLLAMEYLEGQTLTNILRRMGRANMPLELHLFVLTQVLIGLDYAHELRDYDGTALGVVHRDICPSNVIVTYNGEVKLIDFGMARAAGFMSAGERDVSKGKGAYSAPEIVSGEHVDRRADIYSVGVMLWEALARKRRNPAESSSAAFHALQSGASSRSHEVYSAAPVRLADICDRALATDPIERYASAVEFLSDLEEYLEAHLRRVDRRDLSSLMMQLFRGDRHEMAKRIEEQVGAVRTVPSVAPQAHSVSPSRAPTVMDVGRHKVSSAPVSMPPDAQRSWMRRNGFAVGASLVGAVALVGFTLKMKARSIASPAPVTAAATAAPRPARAEPRAPAAASPVDERPRPQSNTVQFIVKVEPGQATVYLDGKKLASNPFQGDALRETAGLHTVRATAPGYYTVERTVNFARDFNLTIMMRAIPPSGPAPRQRAAPEPAAPPPEPKEVEPGTDLQRGEAPRSGRQIDEKDPYAR